MRKSKEELNETFVEAEMKREKGIKPEKKMNTTLIAIIAAAAFIGLAVALFFFINLMKEKSAIEKITGNDIVIIDGVVYLDDGSADTSTSGDTSAKEDKPIVQYEKPEKGDVIAKIKVKGHGTIVVRFFPEHAPLAVENFVTHAKEGYYDGLTFHRIMDDFMIQGGDPKGNGTGGESIWTDDNGDEVPFTDEYSKYLMPIRGALCMANSGANTNGSQFFIVQTKNYIITDVINLRNKGVDDDLVDYYKENGGAGWLYGAHTVFGQVIEGYDVLDSIAGVKVDSQSKPEKDVIIQSIEIDIY